LYSPYATTASLTSGEQVVFLSLDEYNSWKEALYLLANPANAEHLRRSIAEHELLEA
jgi:antitoxin YefM